MVMFYATLALALAGVALVVRWLALRQRTDTGFPAISVGTCAVLAVVVSLPVVVRLNLDSRLGHDASKLLGIHVAVNCQTLTASSIDMGSELGYVKYGMDGVPEHKTLIKHQQCNDLQSYLDSNKKHPSAAQVLAVHVLTHESMHMSGITSEAVAECYAMQHDAQMARIMGAPADAARKLAVRYWKTVYPHMPDGYTTADCRAGGPLDLHLPDAPWST